MSQVSKKLGLFFNTNHYQGNIDYQEVHQLVVNNPNKLLTTFASG